MKYDKAELNDVEASALEPASVNTHTSLSSPIKVYLFSTIGFFGFALGFVFASLLGGGNSRNPNINDPTLTTTPTFASPPFLYTKVLDGECGQSAESVELQMFEGDGDNESFNKVEKCAAACVENNDPLNYDDDDVWNNFNLVGFIVNPTSGRCFCENTNVVFGRCETETTVETDSYDRYDFVPLDAALIGECSEEQGGREIRMFEGNGDNDGGVQEQIMHCGNACLSKRQPLNGDRSMWDGFHVEGFIVHGSGRCYCENTHVFDGKCLGGSVVKETNYKRFNLPNMETGTYFEAVKMLKRGGLLYSNNTELNSALIDSRNTIHTINELYFGFDVQKNQAYCGISSVATILNSLKHEMDVQHADMPVDAVYRPYKYATQSDVFGPCTNLNAILTDEVNGLDGVMMFPYGTTLAQITTVLQCHLNGGVPDEGGGGEGEKFRINMHLMNPADYDVDKFRAIIVEAIEKGMKGEGGRVLVNFRRGEIGQPGGGHWSPIVAYNSDSDSVNIMDTAKYKFAPFWVSVESLYESVVTVDACGHWNWPNAQYFLSEEEKGGDYVEAEVRAKVGCQSRNRGIVTLWKK